MTVFGKVKEIMILYCIFGGLMNKQIQKQEVMDLLLKACPSYKSRWEDYMKDAGYDVGEEQLLYIDFSDFSNHLIELLLENKVDEFPLVFDVVELLHIYGDVLVKQAVTVGLLEDLYWDEKSNSVIPFLKPESLRWWNKLKDFWTNGKLLSDD
jgi:hypothetical protein